MATTFKSLLNKMAQHNRKELHGSIQWPENVLAYMEKEYCLLPKDMVALRCVRRRGSFGGLPAYFVRVCDQVMAHEQGVILEGYRDLDKHPELVLFEGHVLESGPVYLRKNDVIFPQSDVT